MNLLISSASAYYSGEIISSKEYEIPCPNNICYTHYVEKSTEYVGYSDVKINGSYYKKEKYQNKTIGSSTNSTCRWTDPAPVTFYKYVKYGAKEVVKEYGVLKTIKTTKSKGKIYKHANEYLTTTYGDGSTKTKKMNKKVIKYLYAYYKTYPMPSFKVNRVKKTKFKGKTIIYGRWGKEWGLSTLSGNNYKVTAVGSKVKYKDYRYWKFSKKPKHFTVYMYV